MNIGRLCINRPVMTTLVMFAILLFGLISYQSLPISNLPNVDFPTIQVTSNLPGASAETMASSVSIPLEKQFATIAGLDQMTSTSTLGQSTITLQFNQARNMDGASMDVQAAITASAKQLPPQMSAPPTFTKVNPASQPVFYLSVSSQSLPMHEVDYYAQTLIAQRLSRIAGVAQVQINGAQQYAVRIQLDPKRLSSYGVGVEEVTAAVSSANQSQPTGTLWGAHQAYTIEANGQLLNADAYRNIIISSKNGAPLRLSQVATIIDSVQNDKAAGTYNDVPAVILAVLKQPGSNTIEVVDNIKRLLPEFRSAIPSSIELDSLYDQSIPIRESAKDVQLTLLLTVALVVIVIFLFLGNISATVIPSLSLPISIVGTFAAMKLLGFSLNNLTLMALSLAVGFVVDDAIVMLENIVRHMESGKSAMESAIEGSREIGFTIVSMTLSLVAVFIPVLLLPGIVGRLFNEFAITISVAILISGFISLTLTPMLCSRFLKPKSSDSAKAGGMGAFSARAFAQIQNIYEGSLGVALEHKLAVTVASVLMVAVAGWLLIVIPKGFIPEEDTSQIVVMTEGAQGTSFDSMVRHHGELTKVIRDNENVESVMSSIGVGNGSPNVTLNQGRILVVLKPKEERKSNAGEVIEQLTPALSRVHGIVCYLQIPPSITIGGQVTKSLYQYTLSSPDMKTLYSAARKLEKRLESTHGFKDVATDLQVDNPEVHLRVNRDRCAQFGLTMEQVQSALESAYAGRQISTMYTSTNQNWVILEVAPKFYKDPSVLDEMFIRSGSGQLIPLRSVASIEMGTGPLLVNHVGQFPSVTLSFNLEHDVSLGSAVETIKELSETLVPKSITTSFQGAADTFLTSLNHLWILLVLAVLVIYIVLGILYESFIHPITILSGLPSAAVGALLTLLICRVDLDIYGFLGLIMLIGIVKKNAIMMIDFALEAERAGKEPEQSIYEACCTRFRPIMMTTMAALMGAIPIALGLGSGSETRQPLGLTVVGGLLVSQLVTLYITPVFYIYLARLQRRVLKRDPVANQLQDSV